MTLILESEQKLIFYKPGIQRYAMRRASMQLGATQTGAERRVLLSQSLRRGWDEARAELAALQRLRALMPPGRAEQLRNHIDTGAATTSQNEAPATALTRQQFH